MDKTFDAETLSDDAYFAILRLELQSDFAAFKCWFEKQFLSLKWISGILIALNVLMLVMAIALLPN